MGGDSLQPGGAIFCARNPQQAQILLGEDRTQARRNGGVARNLQRAAAVDGNPQVAQEYYTAGAGFDVATHLFASEWFESAIQILGEVGKQFATFGGMLLALG